MLIKILLVSILGLCLAINAKTVDFSEYNSTLPIKYPIRLCYNFHCAYETNEGKLAFPFMNGLYGDFFNNGLAKILIDEKYGLINVKGDIVVPAIFDEINSFSSNGLASVKIKNRG